MRSLSKNKIFYLLLLLAVCILTVRPAQASGLLTTLPSAGQCFDYPGDGAATCYSTGSMACEQYFSNEMEPYGWSNYNFSSLVNPYSNVNEANCLFNVDNGGATYARNVILSVSAAVCPLDSTGTYPSACTCAAGFAPATNGSWCQANAACPAGSVYDTAYAACVPCGGGLVPDATATSCVMPTAVCVAPQVLNVSTNTCVTPVVAPQAVGANGCQNGFYNTGTLAVPVCVNLFPPAPVTAPSTTGGNASVSPASPTCTPPSTLDPSGTFCQAATPAGVSSTNGTATGPAATESTLSSINDSLIGPSDTFGNASADGTKNDFNTQIAAHLDNANTGQAADEFSLFGAFVFDPPYAACQPIVRTIHGVSMTIDLCPYVEHLRSLIAWLLALFGAYSMYGTIFRAKS